MAVESPVPIWRIVLITLAGAAVLGGIALYFIRR